MQTIEMREKQMNIRLNVEEIDRLHRVAEHYGLNITGLIRFLLKKEDNLLAPTPGIESKPGDGWLHLLTDAQILVQKAALPDVKLLTDETRSDKEGSWFALTDGKFIVEPLDLEGLEKTIADWKKNGTPKTREPLKPSRKPTSKPKKGR